MQRTFSVSLVCQALSHLCFNDSMYPWPVDCHFCKPVRRACRGISCSYSSCLQSMVSAPPLPAAHWGSPAPWTESSLWRSFQSMLRKSNHLIGWEAFSKKGKGRERPWDAIDRLGTSNSKMIIMNQLTGTHSCWAVLGHCIDSLAQLSSSGNWPCADAHCPLQVKRIKWEKSGWRKGDPFPLSTSSESSRQEKGKAELMVTKTSSWHSRREVG